MTSKISASAGGHRATVLALAFVPAVLLCGCVNREAQRQAKRTEAILQDATRPVKVRPVSLQPISETLDVTGEVTTSQDAQVGAKIGGRLVAVYIRDGDPVKAGQLLAIQDTSDVMAKVRQASAQVSSARSQLSQAMANAAIQPSKSSAAVRSAEAQLRQSKASFAKTKAGARQEEIKQAQSKVDAAESAMNLAKKDLDRTTKLVDEGAIPRARLDAAQNNYTTAVAAYQQALEQLSMQKQWARPEDLEMAREQVKQAEEALRQARAQKKLDVLLNDQVSAARANLDASIANLDLTRQAMEDARIKAPFSGRVSGRPSVAGTYLSPGATVARIVGGAGTYFEGEVPESMIAQIDTGKGVRVNIDALPGRTIFGSVVAVSPAGEQLGRIFKVRVQLGAGLEGVKPGMFARGSIDLRTIPNATVVPQTAVLESAGEKYVFVVEKDQAKKVVVKTGIRKGELIQVMGLNPGQQVVIDGQGQLADGTKITIEGNKVNTVAGAKL